MSGVVYADLTPADRARLVAEEQLRQDLARFIKTKGCPEYLRGSASTWLDATAAVTR